MADEQRTWNEIKMTPEERDDFLRAERICRVSENRIVSWDFSKG